MMNYIRLLKSANKCFITAMYLIKLRRYSNTKLTKLAEYKFLTSDNHSQEKQGKKEIEIHLFVLLLELNA